MSKLRDPKSVAAATGCPVAAISSNLPLVLAALDERQILLPNVVVGVIATIAIESAHTFKPVAEAYWLPEWDRLAYYNGTAYGKVDHLTGQRYFGRGFIQNTWKYQYITLAQALQIDCVNHPDLLLDPKQSARALAYFITHKSGLVAAFQAGNWRLSRKLVNGGYNKLDEYLAVIDKLLPLAKEG